MTQLPRIATPKTVLFLCTGNYYRSRHAEAVFNHHAMLLRLDWRAVSRGLRLELGVFNFGPISRSTVQRLTALGIPHLEYLRPPMDVSENDLTAANLVVALKEAEHRPMLARRFPAWETRVEFWHVHDVDCAGPEWTLPHIEHEVGQLVSRLSNARYQSCNGG